MGLTEEQYADMYKCTLKNSTDIEWIRETLKAQTINIKDCQEHIVVLDSAEALSKGKITYLVAGVASIFTIIVNGLLWLLASHGGK